jgi:hypothetical protein
MEVYRDGDEQETEVAVVAPYMVKTQHQSGSDR